MLKHCRKRRANATEYTMSMYPRELLSKGLSESICNSMASYWGKNKNFIVYDMARRPTVITILPHVSHNTNVTLTMTRWKTGREIMDAEPVVPTALIQILFVD